MSDLQCGRLSHSRLKHLKKPYSKQDQKRIAEGFINIHEEKNE